MKNVIDTLSEFKRLNKEYLENFTVTLVYEGYFILDF